MINTIMINTPMITTIMINNTTTMTTKAPRKSGHERV
jgi:hypothetical protein